VALIPAVRHAPLHHSQTRTEQRAVLDDLSPLSWMRWGNKQRIEAQITLNKKPNNFAEKQSLIGT
jgi:hypothetical protein